MSCQWWSGFFLSVVCLMGTACRPSDEILLSDAENPHVANGLDQVRSLDFDQAIEAFEKALEANPKSVRAHFELGVIYEREKRDFITALYHYNQVLKLQEKGWPVENVELLIEGCRQELIKSEALAPVAYAMQRELEELRKENRALQKELASARAAAQSNPSGRATQAAAVLPVQPSPGQGGNTPPPPAALARVNTRLHRVQPGETMAAISRRYRVDLNRLLAANPQIKPRSMAVGQQVRIPAP